MTGNRIEEHAARLREAIARGEKVDGSGPIGDLDALDRSLAVDFSEHAAYQDCQAWAHATGLLTTDEALTVYHALGEVGSPDNGGWAASADVALKTTVTALMGEILPAKMRATGSRYSAAVAGFVGR